MGGPHFLACHQHLAGFLASLLINVCSIDGNVQTTGTVQKPAPQQHEHLNSEHF